MHSQPDASAQQQHERRSGDDNAEAVPSTSVLRETTQMHVEGSSSFFCFSFRSTTRVSQISTIESTSLTASRARNASIDAALSREAAERKHQMKILLLGGPECGKSTIFKQMRILHTSGFSPYDLVNFRFIIHANVVQATEQLIEGARLLMIIPDKDTAAAIDEFERRVSSSLTADADALAELAPFITRIYRSEAAARTLARRNEVAMLDSAQYFLESVERLASPSFMPTNDDVLRARSPTTGIAEMSFPFRGRTLRMIDVGGQRAERRKWLHCFDDVNGVLFIVDVSGYDQWVDQNELSPQEVAKQAETSKSGAVTASTRLRHSMAIFASVAASPAFQTHTAIILFLNKTDVFREKITKVPLTVCFSRYKGAPGYESAAKYISERFRMLLPAKKAAGKGRADEDDAVSQLYVHMTTATDTESVSVVFNSCIDVVLQNNLMTLGAE